MKDRKSGEGAVDPVGQIGSSGYLKVIPEKSSANGNGTSKSSHGSSKGKASSKARSLK